MVNGALTGFVGDGERWAALTSDMETPFITPFISGPSALAEASDLIARFGDDAGLEAAARAEQSRDDGNLIRFCHWRQIERVIATLSCDEVLGTIH